MSKPERIGIYPGTFDPITTGHLDIIKRSLSLVDRLVIAVAQYSDKDSLFSLQERVEMVHHEIQHHKLQEFPIEVHPFETLLIDFARKIKSGLLIRGLRAVSDFEYEFKMAAMNSHLAPEIETVFLMASERYQFVSSRFVKQVAQLEGDISAFVSPDIQKKLCQRLKSVIRK